MTYNEILGNKGEQIAAKYLKAKGYTLLSRNFHARGGEIDLIFKSKSGQYIFAEVKTRSSDKFGLAKEAITQAKLSKILSAIEDYFKTTEEMPDFRIDIVCVRKKNEKFYVSHYKNISFADLNF